MSRTLVLISGLALAFPAFAQSQQPQPATQPAPIAGQPKAAPDAPAATPRIEVVFVLDTTGSMGGLIEGAKQKIWSIANAIASAKPKPQIRMGLVAYRDRGDDYVTRLTPLTDDLDALYADLMKCHASGGGDGPESVNQALHEAYTKFEWSADKSTLRLIYLVGDAPPHMDYENDTKYLDTCSAAIAHGITINTIQCGGQTDTTPIWQEIARKTDGEYLAIEQSGGMTAVATPFDEELAKLGRDLEGTVVAYGNREELAAQTIKMDMAVANSTAPAASPEASAERACYKASEAGASSLTGRNDLVQACIDGKIEAQTIADDQLTDEMKKMTPEERAKFIEAKIEARKQCQARIAELGEKRQLFIKDKVGESKDSFGQAVRDTLAKQAARVGIKYGK
ncbi:MAG: vWA domain-containing protein [Phycisphaerales bacterium]